MNFYYHPILGLQWSCGNCFQTVKIDFNGIFQEMAMKAAKLSMSELINATQLQ